MTAMTAPAVFDQHQHRLHARDVMAAGVLACRGGAPRGRGNACQTGHTSTAVPLSLSPNRGEASPPTQGGAVDTTNGGPGTYLSGAVPPGAASADDQRKSRITRRGPTVFSAHRKHPPHGRGPNGCLQAPGRNHLRKEVQHGLLHRPGGF